MGPGDIRFQDELHGDLFTQADGAIDLLLTKYTAAAIDFRGRQRVETYPVPEDALREAVHNAIIHKDYASGAPVQISVYRDKIMLWNPGQLPPELTPARLFRKHPSLPANPDVANAFFKAGMIEAWGDGYERIVEACHAVGNPKPKVRREADGIWIEFAFSDKYLACVQGKLKKDVSGGTTQETPVETPVETLGKTLGKTPGRIVDLLLQDPHMTVPELASALSRSESAAQRAIQKLQKAGVLRRVGSRKSGHWKILNKGNHE